MSPVAGSEAEHLLADVLRRDVLSVDDVEATDGGADLLVRFQDGETLTLEVKAAAHPSPDQVARLLGDARLGRHKKATPVLVADVLTAPIRTMLAEAGWGFFDRRGRLYLQSGPRHLELDVPARPRDDEASSRSGIRGTSGIAVAYASLLEPDHVLGVRELTRASGLRSPTSVSNARHALAKANLLEPDGRPVVPDLFWALAGHWSRPLHGLAHEPTPDAIAELRHNVNGPYFERLAALAHTDADASAFEGVAVGGDLAAELYGAPIVRTKTSPFDLYLPGAVVLSQLKRRYGEAPHLTERTAGVRSFPASVVARTRLPARPGSRGFPLVHPLVAALDLAQDPARGREILEGFEPEGFARVW